MSTLLAAALGTLVFCAPGYPGAAGDAQPLVDQFAGAAAAASGWPAGSLAAVYDPTEEGGLAKLGQADAVLAFVPYPFFVEHAAQLHLTPLVQADVTDVGPQQRWTLVAKAGRIAGPASMAGYTLLSVAGYAPDFVRHGALAAWALPPDVKIQATGQILSVLRRVAAGEPVAALLDQTQAAALPSLPFAAELKAVTQSEELPVAVIAVVGSRIAAARARALQTALLKMGREPGGADTLGPLRLHGFVLPKLPPRTAQ
ncbi:MAG TPA: PhnD/SsuA/transferrin family substrate-binding protein [Steroidobacteraceae bacterium]|nr:PhnD/SsuA/transferrin family substrate-binding protein [Steroidobacteraceae bacterium]